MIIELTNEGYYLASGQYGGRMTVAEGTSWREAFKAWVQAGRESSRPTSIILGLVEKHKAAARDILGTQGMPQAVVEAAVGELIALDKLEAAIRKEVFHV